MSPLALSEAVQPSPTAVAPRPALGLAAYLTYVVTIFVVGLVMGVDYDEIADSSGNIVKGIIVPIALGSLLMAAFATRLGWWGLVLRERPTGPRWLLVVPVLVLLSCVAGAADTPWGDWDTDVLVLLAIGTLLVGFGEEMALRHATHHGPARRLDGAALPLGLHAARLAGSGRGGVPRRRRRRRPPGPRDVPRGDRDALRHAQPRTHPEP